MSAENETEAAVWLKRYRGYRGAIPLSEDVAALATLLDEAQAKGAEMWRPEAKRVEEEIVEFGHPMPGQGNHHEIRDWLIEAFEAGKAAAREERELAAAMKIMEAALRFATMPDSEYYECLAKDAKVKEDEKRATLEAAARAALDKADKACEP